MPTVAVDVAFGLGKPNLSTDEVKHRVEKALASVGIPDYSQRLVQTLSEGQKQRVAIAGALAELSKKLLLDELTTYLDETDQAPFIDMMGVVEAVKNCIGGHDQGAALLVTHPLEELQYADLYGGWESRHAR